MNRLLCWSGICLGLILLCPLNVSAALITDLNRSYVASGGTAPPPGPEGSVVIDNDFRIRNWADNGGLVGDGIDDETRWVFHFAENNAKRASFLAFENDLLTGRLVQADVWLQLTPMNIGIATDFFELIDLGVIGMDETDAFDNLQNEIGVMHTVHFNLLDFFSPQQLTDYILGRRGILGARFADDAIMYTAKMDLRAVPEPASLILFGAALLGLIGTARRIGQKKLAIS